jgi:hypothetical protein
LEIPEYCRQIESYLCQKNDGHLIRVAGPSFDLVSRWAARGVPLKVAFRGIDRYFERYYRGGPRRRPVRIDFCEDDVLDVFDEWRRATGLQAAGTRGSEGSEISDTGEHKSGMSLPAHLTRALMRLTDVRTREAIGPEADGAIDRLREELDRAHASAGGLRGAARQALISRLEELDRELLRIVEGSLDQQQRTALERQADEDLAMFRESMPQEAYRRVRQTAIGNLARERLGLPTLRYR